MGRRSGRCLSLRRRLSRRRRRRVRNEFLRLRLQRHDDAQAGVEAREDARVQRQAAGIGGALADLKILADHAGCGAGAAGLLLGPFHAGFKGDAQAQLHLKGDHGRQHQPVVRTAGGAQAQRDLHAARDLEAEARAGEVGAERAEVHAEGRLCDLHLFHSQRPDLLQRHLAAVLAQELDLLDRLRVLRVAQVDIVAADQRGNVIGGLLGQRAVGQLPLRLGRDGLHLIVGEGNVKVLPRGVRAVGLAQRRLRHDLVTHGIAAVARGQRGHLRVGLGRVVRGLGRIGVQRQEVVQRHGDGLAPVQLAGEIVGEGRFLPAEEQLARDRRAAQADGQHVGQVQHVLELGGLVGERPAAKVLGQHVVAHGAVHGEILVQHALVHRDGGARGQRFAAAIGQRALAVGRLRLDVAVLVGDDGHKTPIGVHAVHVRHRHEHQAGVDAHVVVVFLMDGEVVVDDLPAGDRLLTGPRVHAQKAQALCVGDLHLVHDAGHPVASRRGQQVAARLNQLVVVLRERAVQQLEQLPRLLVGQLHGLGIQLQVVRILFAVEVQQRVHVLLAGGFIVLLHPCQQLRAIVGILRRFLRFGHSLRRFGHRLVGFHVALRRAQLLRQLLRRPVAQDRQNGLLVDLFHRRQRFPQREALLAHAPDGLPRQAARLGILDQRIEIGLRLRPLDRKLMGRPVADDGLDDVPIQLQRDQLLAQGHILLADPVDGLLGRRALLLIPDQFPEVRRGIGQLRQRVAVRAVAGADVVDDHLFADPRLAQPIGDQHDLYVRASVAVGDIVDVDVVIL